MSEDFPFTSSIKTTDAATELPTFKMYDWNFKKNCFRRDGAGNLILLEENEALRIWIEKAIRTERYSWLAYSFNFGFEGKNLIGSVLSAGERKSELRRFVIESLIVSPYILSVDSVEIGEDAHGRIANISVSLTTIYGKMTI